MKKLILLTLSLSTLFLSACSNNTLDTRVTRVGKSGDISITDLRSAVANNLLVAQAMFHNTGSKAINGFYRCQFMDANKMHVGDVQIWQPITIYSNEEQGIKCMATQIEAVEFKVEFSTDGNNVSIIKN